MKTGNSARFVRTGLVCLLGGLLLVAAGCAETPSDEALALAGCRDALDVAAGSQWTTPEEGWTAAIVACEAVIPADPSSDVALADLGYSLSAQAYMGRAGVTLLDLISAQTDSQLSGLALVLDLFAIDLVAEATRFADVSQALTYFGLLSCIADPDTDCTAADLFNMVVSSDVALTSLFKAHLNITIDETDPDNPVMVIPGITDAGLELLSGTSTAAEIQTALSAVYTTASSYYTTRPLSWIDAGAQVDLQRLSNFVQVNGFAATEMGLADDPALSALDFAAAIDNGQCGLSTGQTASGVADAADGVLIAPLFPRRLNTSDDVIDNAPFEPELITDELQYVVSNEWGGGFVLPSALLNPDFVQIDCGGGFTADDDTDFTSCMTGEKLIANFGAQTEGGTANDICALGACINWPVLAINGNPADDESGTTLAAATDDLAAVLHILYPIDNSVTTGPGSGTHPAYACAAGDGLVHYREYDYYLRSFGQ